MTSGMTPSSLLLWSPRSASLSAFCTSKRCFQIHHILTLSDIVLSLYASRSFVSELYGRIIKQPLSHITVEWPKFSYSLLLLDEEKMMQDAERCPDLLLDDGRCKELSENAQISCFVNRPYDIIPIKDVSVLKRKMVSAGGSKSNRNPCAARISARAASTAVFEPCFTRKRSTVRVRQSPPKTDKFL